MASSSQPPPAFLADIGVLRKFSELPDGYIALKTTVSGNEEANLNPGAKNALSNFFGLNNAKPVFLCWRHAKPGEDIVSGLTLVGKKEIPPKGYVKLKRTVCGNHEGDINTGAGDAIFLCVKKSPQPTAGTYTVSPTGPGEPAVLELGLYLDGKNPKPSKDMGWVMQPKNVNEGSYSASDKRYIYVKQCHIALSSSSPGSASPSTASPSTPIPRHNMAFHNWVQSFKQGTCQDGQILEFQALVNSMPSFPRSGGNDITVFKNFLRNGGPNAPRGLELFKHCWPLYIKTKGTQAGPSSPQGRTLPSLPTGFQRSQTLSLTGTKSLIGVTVKIKAASTGAANENNSGILITPEPYSIQISTLEVLRERYQADFDLEKSTVGTLERLAAPFALPETSPIPDGYISEFIASREAANLAAGSSQTTAVPEDNSDSLPAYGSTAQAQRRNKEMWECDDEAIILRALSATYGCEVGTFIVHPKRLENMPHITHVLYVYIGKSEPLKIPISRNESGTYYLGFKERVGIWQWEDGNQGSGQYKDYPDPKIDRAYRASIHGLNITAGNGKLYRLEFRKEYQQALTHPFHGSGRRRIRRRETSEAVPSFPTLAGLTQWLQACSEGYLGPEVKRVFPNTTPLV